MPRVALLELPGAPEPLGVRLKRLEDALVRAKAEGARLALTPEAFLPGYAPAARAPADAGDIPARLEALARAHGMAFACGFLDGARCSLGLAVPGAPLVRYAKRFPTPAESRGWARGAGPLVAETPMGRLGLLLCADVLHADSWRPLRGNVDAVLVAGAWPDYRGRRAALPPGIGALAAPVIAGSNAWREALLPRAARFVGAPVLWCNAVGPYPAGAPGEAFSGGSAAWSASGSPSRATCLPLREGRIVLVEADFGGDRSPSASLGMSLGWRAFARAYRLAGQIAGSRWTGGASAPSGRRRPDAA
jgi:predicted amidohydrolase